MARRRRERKPSEKWMTFREVADHFQVSEATVRLGRGVFKKLPRVPLTPKCIRIPRAAFEKLDREMEKAAVSLDGGTNAGGPHGES